TGHHIGAYGGVTCRDKEPETRTTDGDRSQHANTDIAIAKEFRREKTKEKMRRLDCRPSQGIQYHCACRSKKRHPKKSVNNEGRLGVKADQAQNDGDDTNQLNTHETVLNCKALARRGESAPLSYSF